MIYKSPNGYHGGLKNTLVIPLLVAIAWATWDASKTRPCYGKTTYLHENECFYCTFDCICSPTSLLTPDFQPKSIVCNVTYFEKNCRKCATCILCSKIILLRTSTFLPKSKRGITPSWWIRNYFWKDIWMFALIFSLNTSQGSKFFWVCVMYI